MMNMYWIFFLLWGPVMAAHTDLRGTWRGELPDEAGPVPFVLILESQTGEKVTGFYISREHQGMLKADYSGGILDAAVDFGGGVVFTGKLKANGSVISGTLGSKTLNLNFPVRLHRAQMAGIAAIGIEEVDPEIPRPGRVYQDDLPRALKEPVRLRIERHLEENGIVGMATAVLFNGRIADLRCYGWQNYAERVSLSDKTMFRWASISKPLTAITAMQLEASGKLKLDRDVRDYVPEFPAKPWPVTSRQLLAHHAGLVHYHPGKVIVTERNYQTPHPFSDRILALDKFKESALLFEPGARFSYSTPGYALLGAVIQRAGEAVYEDQVRGLILDPLGMTSMRPDYPHAPIPNRTLGYRKVLDRFTIESGDSDVSWKLAAGGWISTIRDLGRFGEGILAKRLAPEAVWETMWTPRQATDGKPSSYGYGFNVTEKDGLRIVFHSGAQRKTQTMLMLCPDKGFGIAVMSNTEGVRHESLSFDIISLLAAP